MKYVLCESQVSCSSSDVSKCAYYQVAMINGVVLCVVVLFLVVRAISCLVIWGYNCLDVVDGKVICSGYRRLPVLGLYSCSEVVDGKR